MLVDILGSSILSNLIYKDILDHTTILLDCTSSYYIWRTKTPLRVPQIAKIMVAIIYLGQYLAAVIAFSLVPRILYPLKKWFKGRGAPKHPYGFLQKQK